MGLRINTNIASLNAQRNLASNKLRLDKNLERLASGYRINNSGDDAAGLAVSESLKAQIRGLKQASRNAQNGIAVIQIAEGALNEVSSILIRLRELAVQSSSDTMGDIERGFMQLEYSQLIDEIDRISDSTRFNGIALLNGTSKQLDFQIGIKNDPFIDRLSVDTSKTNTKTSALGMNKTGISNKKSAQKTLGIIDQALIHVSKVRAQFGAIQNRLQSVVNNLGISVSNMLSAKSRIADVDVAEETSELTKNKILVQAGTAVLAQANLSSEMALDLLGNLR